MSESCFLFSHSVVSNSLRPHELQHARHPCPLPSPGACLNSCPSSWWCHPTISSSVVPFSCLQSFVASGCFPMSQFFASGGHSIRGSASASVLPMNIQDWLPLGWTGWISLHSKGLSRVFSNTTVQIINSLAPSLLYGPTLDQLLDLAQTHVHPVSDAIQPIYPLSCLSPPAVNLSQHQSLFKWVSSSHQVTKVLEFQLQHQSFQ